MPRRLLVILNPAASAGRARERFAAVLDPLRAQPGLELDIRHTQHEGHALELARAAAPDFDGVVAAGGDGTVREVASGLILSGATRCALGILPGGTGNDVATQTGLAAADAALAALAGTHTRLIDAIEARWREGGRDCVQHALLFAAVGFAADLLRLTGPRVKRLFGQRLSYVVGFLRALAGSRQSDMRLEADGVARAGRFFHVCAGNSEWAGGGVMRLSPGARMDDGRLELCTIEAIGRLEVLRCFPMLLRGTFPSHPKVRYFPGRELRISAEPARTLALDGDVVGTTPVAFRVCPGALRLLVPEAV